MDDSVDVAPAAEADRIEGTVRAYYDAIDADAYDRLSDLLDPEFVHDRPDRRLEGRERFIAFMREERPITDTEHVVDRVYSNGTGAAVQGRLRNADGGELFGYVDVFDLDGTVVTRLETYVSDED